MPDLPPVPRFRSDADPHEVAEALRTLGCAVVEDVASSDLLDQFRSEITPFLEVTSTGTDDFSGRNTRRSGGLIARSPAAREMVMHPLVLDVVRGVLDTSRKFHLHLTQLIAIGPDSPGQMIHRDQWAFDFFPFPVGYDVQCNTIWALTDFCAANGGTRVMPGSNTYGDKERFGYEDTVAVEMPRGSVLFYTGSLYHGGGANGTDTVRMGVNITYARSWLRQEENQYLSCPPEVARTLPEDLLKLMGYARGAYALGYVDDLRDPLDVLLDRQGTSTLASS